MTPAPALTRRQSDVLGGLLDDVKGRSAARPLVVFDVDDTLLSTAQRHLRILREYAAGAVGRRDAAVKLRGIGHEQLCYSIAETVKKAGVDDAALLEELRAFWFARFFTNEYIRADAQVPGAALYCRQTRAAGARVVYLTGRDETMREGTLAAFDAHGFPIPDGDAVQLILKPRFDIPDSEFKAQAVARLKTMGTLLGSFDNEPSHVNLFQESFPRSRTIFVATKHSGKPVVPRLGIPHIRDFVL